MTAKLVAVITTIQEPTPSVRRLASRLADARVELLAVGDRKGPARFDVAGARLLSLEAQLQTPYTLARLLPVGHYSRKNVGYLQALAEGASCVYETDDDSHPNAAWAPRTRRTSACPVAANGWLNAYSRFSKELVWPRGLPLDRVRGGPEPSSEPERLVDSPIQQGLADLSPDVDAVWRLLLDRDLRFDRGASIALQPGTWCPFNSQSTWWWEPAFALMYLPSHCSFRMTDIWRSFVAQRCLWALGMPVVFHAPEVEQVRNEHDLMRDFEQEIPGYLGNRRMVEVLERVSLSSGVDGVRENLLRCYDALVTEGFVPAKEIELVRAWNDDLARIEAARSR